METIDIEVINWSRYNPRKDHKHPRWFAFSNDFFNDPKFYSFTHSEIVGWIYILCMASKENSSMVKLYFDHMQYATKTTKAEITVLFKKLEKHQCIQVRVLGKYSTLHYNTIQNTNVQTAVRTIQPVQFDFNAVYQKYPRKQGKQLGIKRCLAQIKTQKSYDDLLLAIENYKKYLAQNKIEKQYVKMFSTFMTSWKDYLDQDFGQFSLEPKLEGYPTERIGDLRWDLPVSDPRHPRHGVVKD